MASLKIDVDSTFDVDVTVRESDKYSKLVFVKFEKNFAPENMHSCSEMFLTPMQLELLGRFLIRQADEIHTAQEIRHKTEISQG
jgi:hypothetical protein